jgi:hypothetical protein
MTRLHAWSLQTKFEMERASTGGQEETSIGRQLTQEQESYGENDAALQVRPSSVVAGQGAYGERTRPVARTRHENACMISVQRSRGEVREEH